MKPLAATGRSLGLPAFVLALATAIGLGVGFGVSITNLQSALGTTQNNLALAQARAAQQEAIVAEIILNSTEPAPVRNVLQTGEYSLFVDWGSGSLGFGLYYRVVEIRLCRAALSCSSSTCLIFLPHCNRWRAMHITSTWSTSTPSHCYPDLIRHPTFSSPSRIASAL